MAALGTSERPLRVAIVGSGPSGFYAAGALFKADIVAHVEMFDRLPTPFGLVRGGVAPDHAKIKNVTRIYEKIAAHEHFTFRGNVEIGRDISVAELRTFFDAIIFATGAETDRHINIPGEDLPGSHTATAFVGWYNGHPDYRDCEFDLSGETAVVIGVGNVAMDVCRILSKTVAELRSTDIAEHALTALAESQIRNIMMIGRRGAAQAKFSPAEIKELVEMENCRVHIDPAELVLNAASKTELADKSAANSQKNIAIMRGYAEATTHSADASTTNTDKTFTLRFCLSPTALHGTTKLERVTLEKNTLTGEAFKQRCAGTGETIDLPCDLLFRSIGYRGVAIAGVPFHDAWGVLPNEAGRITREDGTADAGLYTVGWIKRGPSGVIGNNKPCSVETVKTLMGDLAELSPCSTPAAAAVSELLASRAVREVSFLDWQRIDAAEIARGETVGKPREKFTRIQDMLTVLDEVHS